MQQGFPAGSSSDLRLERYFDGKVRATGIFQDRFGKPRRQFSVDVEGQWDGKTLTLVEDFVFDDGEIDHRTWHIRPVGEDGYEGRSSDVIGAANGAVKGNTLNWKYPFRLRLGKQTLQVQFNDWFFLLDDNVLVNRAEVSKFGIQIGQTTIVFRH